MRGCLTIVLLGALVAGCGTRGSTAVTSRVNRCADRLLSRSTPSGGSKHQARRYVIRTYCAPFDDKGWVYEDGALSIAAQNWLDKGGVCASGTAGEPTRTVPCEQTAADKTRTIDCALLHHVRRAQVVRYVARLERNADVQCDDGTPVAQLGVP